MVSRLRCDWCWHYWLCTSVWREIIWKPHSLSHFNENSDLLHTWQVNSQNKLKFLSNIGPINQWWVTMTWAYMSSTSWLQISSPCYCIKHIISHATACVEIPCESYILKKVFSAIPMWTVRIIFWHELQDVTAPYRKTIHTAINTFIPTESLLLKT
jgi:hypothetical protein